MAGATQVICGDAVSAHKQNENSWEAWKFLFSKKQADENKTTSLQKSIEKLSLVRLIVTMSGTLSTKTRWDQFLSPRAAFLQC